MAKEKMMNEARFSKLMGEFDSLGELIRTRQGEKQVVMDEFDKERKRYTTGKISEKTTESSARKTNAEMMRLNKSIRDVIAKANKLGGTIRELVSNQAPKVFRARVSGITLATTKKSKKKVKKKAAKKKAAVSVSRVQRKKELTLDKKYQK